MDWLSRIRTHFIGRVATLFLATAFSAIASIALLPFATQVLHASDYGTYALLMSIVTLVSAATDGGASLIFPSQYRSANSLERGRIFVSVALVASAGAVAIGSILTIAWNWYHSELSDRLIPVSTIAITMAIAPLRTITTISVIAFSVTERSGAIAAQMATQAALVFIGTLVALFIFSMDGLSLFIGAACGQFAAVCVCLTVLFYDNELSRPSRRWLRGGLTVAPSSGVSGLMDGARAFSENAMLVSVSGLHSAGIFSHARLYYNLLTALGGAITHNIWGKSLEDSTDLTADFKRTQSAWAPMQMALSGAGLVFVFFGSEIVNIITNGKLVEAAPYIPAFVILALIQITEQPAAAIVFASGRAISATWFRTAITFGGIVVLYPTLLFAGIYGILAVGIIEAAVYRYYLRLLASRERKVPFQDGIAYFACAVTFIAMIYAGSTTPSLGQKLAAMTAGILSTAFVGRRSIAEIIVAVRRIIAPMRSPKRANKPKGGW
jgi:O-antigen/teichoic acid export membrane protein